MAQERPKKIRVGTAVSKPGTIQYGEWPAVQHPTGHSEFLPVIIAQGREPGPCVWLTAGIHGMEQAGPLVIYKLLTKDLVQRMCGTIVAIPALSPMGLCTGKDTPFYTKENPNGLWPDGAPKDSKDRDKEPPNVLEVVYASLFEKIKETANCLIDYHNHYVGSIPFAIRDRILYHAGGKSERNRQAAKRLMQELDEILRAYGHTTVTDVPGRKYTDDEFHRSTSGATLILGRIPAFTVELGAGMMPDPKIIHAATAGTRNVLRHLSMLQDGLVEPISPPAQISAVLKHLRRKDTPRVTKPCVIIHRRRPGDWMLKGEVIAEMSDVWGRPLRDGEIHAEEDGLILTLVEGIYRYPGDAICEMAVVDRSPLIVPYPKDFFRKSKR